MAKYEQYVTERDLELKEAHERLGLPSYRLGHALTWPLRRMKKLFVSSSNGRAKKRVLYICHNHPSVSPGGAEIYALELYEAVRQSDEFEPWLLARSGQPDSAQMRPGTRLSMVGDDPNQYLFFNDLSEFDFFYGTAVDQSIYTNNLREFLSACQPDIVHIQHTHLLGYDVLPLIKQLFPTTPIVYTLHEYLPICHQSGQMTRTTLGNENCLEASPRRCNECFPKTVHSGTFLVSRSFSSAKSILTRAIC